MLPARASTARGCRDRDGCTDGEARKQSGLSATPGLSTSFGRTGLGSLANRDLVVRRVARGPSIWANAHHFGIKTDQGWPVSGFCGRIGDLSSSPDRIASAERPAEQLASGANERRVAHRDDVGELVASLDPVTGSYTVDRSIVAVIEGYPRWTDPGRMAKARQVGHAAVLAAAYRADGVGLLGSLKGAFSLAILDVKSREAVLAIDRHGIGALYYCAQGDGKRGQLGFATSAGPVRAQFPEAAEVSAQSIFDFFFFIDRIPAPHTIYRGIKKLPPGSFLRHKDGEATVRRYWQLDYGRGRSAKPKDQLGEQLVEHLRGSVESCLTVERPDKVGCFLSGGLDSSTVLALLSEVSGGGARSFTIGFRPEGFDESPYAALAARAFGSQHDIYYLEPNDVLEAVPKVAAAYEEPFANSSAIPAYFCALRARADGLDMLLAGDGGDELFAGNSRYLSDRVFEPYAKIPGFLRHRLIEPFFDSVPAAARVPLLRKLRNYVIAGRLTVPQRMHRDNLYREVPPDEVFSAQVLEEVSASRPQQLIEEIYQSVDQGSKVQKMMNLDLRLTLADSDLRKVDGMCRLAGMRVRFPFLDDELVDFSAQIPPELLLEGGLLRGFYKKALSGVLPKAIIEKEKKGFGLPYVNLLRGHAPLKRLASDCLESLGARGYFRPAFLESISRAVDAADAGPLDGYVWDLMVLELWFQAHQP